MINTAITNYDVMTAQPRVNALQVCITNVEKLLDQIRGGMIVVKWASATLAFVGTTAGIVYTVGKIAGHL